MLFALICRDRADGGQLRADNRQAHLAYLQGHEDQIVFGGPLLADDGQRPIGSLLVIDVPDRWAAEAFAAGDPYAEAGLFAKVSIEATRQVFPKY